MAVTAKEKQNPDERDRASGPAAPRADAAADRPDDEGTRGGGHKSEREAQYDLLTAALIGAAVGISATLLLRRGGGRGGRGVRIVTPGMRSAAKRARQAGAKGARWAREQGEALWDRVPHGGGEIADKVRDYADSAREAIDRAVEGELREFRKQLRRQRRRHHI